jgi:hypothetical protein
MSQTAPQPLSQNMSSSSVPMHVFLSYSVAVVAFVASMLFFSSTSFVVEQGRILSREAVMSGEVASSETPKAVVTSAFVR